MLFLPHETKFKPLLFIAHHYKKYFNERLAIGFHGKPVLKPTSLQKTKICLTKNFI